MTAWLEVNGLGKTYGEFEALKPCSFSLEQGDFLAILGPSGCGKTTLLMTLAGLLDHAGGEIHLNGRRLDVVPTEKRRVGMVFQHYALFPNLSVSENITYGLTGPQWPADRRQERLKELLKLADLEAIAAQKPGNLSGGQQQRTALARALAMYPDLLLLDEPLSALDAQLRVKLGEELRRIQREAGVTTIMVTHDQAEAFSLADKVAVMNEGLIEQLDEPFVLYERPATQFVATFVGSMNILHLNAIREGRATGIRPEDVILDLPHEKALRTPFTWVGRVEQTRFRGNFIQVELLLSDFATYIRAEISRQEYAKLEIRDQNFLAVTLPRDRWIQWS